MRMRLLAIGIGLMGFCLAAPAAALAQADAAGSKDHPLLPRFPGYYIEDYDAQDFSAYDFYVTDDEYRTVEGRYVEINYRVKEGAKKGGPVEIGRNYSNLFVQRGGIKVYDNLDEGGGKMTAHMPAAGKTIWVEVAVDSTGEKYTVIVVEPAATALQGTGDRLKPQAALRLGDQGSRTKDQGLAISVAPPKLIRDSNGRPHEACDHDCGPDDVGRARQ